MVYGFGFITHPTLEALLGGGKAGAQQRRRLTQRGWLPGAPMVRSDRDQLAIYPEFGLAALVIGANSPVGLRLPVEQAAEQADRLYASRAFTQLGKALAEAMRVVGSRDDVGLARCAMEIDRESVIAWRDEVRDAADHLAAVAVRVEAAPARIVDASGRYLVELLTGGPSEPHLLHDAPTPLSVGAWVVRDRVHVASARRDFLLPVPDPRTIGLLDGEAVPGDAADGTDDDELAHALFGELSPDEVRAVPVLPAAREPRSRVEELDVEVPWELLVGANSMTRRSHRT